MYYYNYSLIKPQRHICHAELWLLLLLSLILFAELRDEVGKFKEEFAYKREQNIVRIQQLDEMIRSMTPALIEHVQVHSIFIHKYHHGY